jgi:hypothetical protein
MIVFNAELIKKVICNQNISKSKHLQINKEWNTKIKLNKK